MTVTDAELQAWLHASGRITDPEMQRAFDRLLAEVERLREALENEKIVSHTMNRWGRENEAALSLAHEALQEAENRLSAMASAYRVKDAGDCANRCFKARSTPAMQRAAELDAARKAFCGAYRLNDPDRLEGEEQRAAAEEEARMWAHLERLEASE